MDTMIHTIYNANVYVDGTTQLGRAQEIKIPEIELEIDEYKALGLFGSLSLPMGMKELEGEINWNSIYPDVAERLYNPFRAVQLMARSNLMKSDSAGVQREEPLVTILNVQFFKNSPGTFKPKERSEHPASFKANSIKQMVSGKEVFFYDVLSNQFRVNGVDVLAQFRRNIGA